MTHLLQTNVTSVLNTHILGYWMNMRRLNSLKHGKRNSRLKRAIAKSLSWRILGIILLIIIGIIVTGNWVETGIITITFHTIRTVLYVFHELMWERIWP